MKHYQHIYLTCLDYLRLRFGSTNCEEVKTLVQGSIFANDDIETRAKQLQGIIERNFREKLV